MLQLPYCLKLDSTLHQNYPDFHDCVVTIGKWLVHSYLYHWGLEIHAVIPVIQVFTIQRLIQTDNAILCVLVS